MVLQRLGTTLRHIRTSLAGADGVLVPFRTAEGRQLIQLMLAQHRAVLPWPDGDKSIVQICTFGWLQRGGAGLFVRVPDTVWGGLSRTPYSAQSRADN